jgi:hypothetical protein
MSRHCAPSADAMMHEPTKLPADWAKLIALDDVYRHVKTLNGGNHHLAAALVAEALATERLPLFAQVTDRNNRSQWRTFTSEQCHGLKVLPATERDCLSIWPRLLNASAGAYFTLREAADQLWPIPAAVSDKPATHRHRAPNHAWPIIAGEIARRCHDRTGHVVVPKRQNTVVTEMLKWCTKQGWDEPPRSDMAEYVRRIFEALRKV